MINTLQATLTASDTTEPFEDRVDILYHELELATKWQCPSLLLAIYSSEYVHSDAQQALENRLVGLGQKAHHVVVKGQEDADIPLLISEVANLKDAVIFVEGLRWGGEADDFSAYRCLNKHREFFIENRVRVVFWLTETEAIHLAHHAPDYWTFRHRVIEFVDSPRPEQLSPQESTPRGMADFTDSSEDLDAKITLRTALLTDLPEGDESTSARASLLLTLGILHWRRGDFDQAAQFSRNALEQAAKLQDNRFEALCLNAIALVESATGRTRQAIQAYRRAQALAPEQISPWNNLGKLHFKLEEYEDAVEAFQKAVEQNPSDRVSWGGLGDSYYRVGRHDDAIFAFRKALELGPTDHHCWSRLGDVYAQEGQLDEAFIAYQKALEFNRGSASSWLGLGDVYRLQGSDENALLAYRTAIEIDPTNARPWDEMGNIHYNAGAFEEAIQAYEKAIELDLAIGNAYDRLASIYFQNENYAKAIPLLKKGIEIEPDPLKAAPMWNHLGDAYRKLEDYDNAMESYRKADELARPRTEETPVPAEAPVQDEVEVAANGTITGVDLTGPADETLVPAGALVQDEVENPANETIVGADLTGIAEETSADVVATPETFSQVVEQPVSLGADLGLEADETDDVDFAQWLEGLTFRLPMEIVGSENIDVVKQIEAVAEAVPAITDPAEAVQEIEAEAEPVSAEAISDEPVPSADEPIAEPAVDMPVALHWDVAEEALPQGSDPVSTATVAERDAPANQAWQTSPGPAQGEYDSKSAQIWNELGNIYYNIVAYDEAIKALNKAIELDHSYAWTYNNLASIYIHKGSYDEAIPLLEKGIGLLSKSSDKALLWNRLGDAYRRLDQHEKAAEAYQKAVELNPDNVSLLTRARFSLLGNCRA
jgi:tetratricopeptide (TPR) repeat protein